MPLRMPLWMLQWIPLSHFDAFRLDCCGVQLPHHRVRMGAAGSPASSVPLLPHVNEVPSIRAGDSVKHRIHVNEVPSVPAGDSSKHQTHVAEVLSLRARDSAKHRTHVNAWGPFRTSTSRRLKHRTQKKSFDTISMLELNYKISCDFKPKLNYNLFSIVFSWLSGLEQKRVWMAL